MAIELIAIDMDGTLLNPQHQITPAVKQAITAARRKGVHVVLATGRPYVGVQDYLRQLDIQGGNDFCITYNGALVLQAVDGACILQETLGFDDYLHFEQLARQLGVHFQAFDFDTLYTPNKDIGKYTVHEAEMTGIPLKYRSVDEMDRNMRFPKVMMIDEPELLDSAIARIPPETLAQYTLLKSAPYYLEILHKKVDKGAGVKMLADHLGIAQQNVMALGDQANDTAMIEFAGVGVAMGNAIPALKQVAQFVTSSNTEDGVARAIEKFVLNA
ncbi:sugar-phosphatase [Serratia odorifera]|jgi:Cof subfamily protein (haloacid dehalogenase superfamily)|uniref:Cof-like hydrolase n=2 Tax=Serratia odorifera TaxID=618 RepID=D4DZL9_SEROD|nr:sugar-phosphatase [Serratia odorifera]EFE96990.1 Cof-like hydrolase [Serratia odorifera DSM 4582]MBJ2067863.1 sugar-phosphatase [Serratia odorifera]PNK91518.1 Cof-type HAD-IIB family hydrolase [Serratia odorifera]RII72393.1 sugar-phosphatase [Serratia odorifera]VDZ55487.1 Phosphatase YidA [Serratia odorifera]